MSPRSKNEDQLERELAPERMTAPALGSLLLHGALLGGVVVWGLVGGLFHHNRWGSESAGGTIEAKITSALPLPNDQPQNDNVLATETPSPAPAPPEAKPQKVEEPDALAIQGKVKDRKQKEDKKNAAKTQAHQPDPPKDNRAHYGEQSGSNIQRSVQQNTGSGPVSVNSGDFGSRFGYYVTNIERRMNSSWYKQLVDPRTPKGTRAYIVFTIHRDGTVSDIRMDRSSGVPTLDRSCLQAAQRVDSFGNLPAQYNQNTLITSYYCEF